MYVDGLEGVSLKCPQYLQYEELQRCLFSVVDMVCMNEEDRKLQIAMGAHMKQLIGQSFALCFRHLLPATYFCIFCIYEDALKDLYLPL